MPKSLLIPRRLHLFVLKDFQKFWCFREASAGRRRGPTAGIMGRDLPARRPAQRKATHDDPVFIDGIILLDVCQCFERIHFASELLAVAEPAVGMKHDGVGWRKLAVGSLPLCKEIELRELLVATMKPQIQTISVRRGSVERGWHH